MKTVEIKVYSFNELKEAAQKNVIERFLNNDNGYDDFGWRADDEESLFKEDLERLGFENLSFEWDLYQNYSRIKGGFYLHPENFKVTNLKKLNIIAIGDFANPILQKIKDLQKKYNIFNVFGTIEFECNGDCAEYVDNYNMENADEFINDCNEFAENELIDFINDVAYHLKECIQNDYDYFCSEEYAREWLENNGGDILYTEDGRTFNF